jgi:hypothetical protein
MLHIFNNRNDNGIDVTYCCSFGKTNCTACFQQETNAMFSSRDTLHSLFSPWSIVLLEKLTRYQLVKKFPAFYRTRLFNTASTRAHHLSLSRGS